MSIQDVDRKLLWGRAGDQCAFPGCTQELTTTVETRKSGRFKTIVLGEEAHIVAREDDGPRNDRTMPVSERNSYPNLVLLCPTHHTQVDKDKGAHYSVEHLLEMKRQHELVVKRRRDASAGADVIFSQEREDRLLELASMSRGRLIARWLAAGVSPDMACALADDESVGTSTTVVEQLPATGYAFIEGDFGSGKSVAVERLHAEHLGNALEHVDAPVPVYLSAQSTREHESLVDALNKAANGLGNPQKQGVRLVIDGLDEASTPIALQLLDEIRTLANAWPRSQIIVTTRPGLSLNHGETVIKHPSLTDDEATTLVERLGGNRSVLLADSPEIREMLHLPLFTIVATLRQVAGAEAPNSLGAFLQALADEALKRTPSAQGQAFAALTKLARLTIGLDGPAPTSELEDDAAVRMCLETRLVVRVGRSLKFTLPLLEQYFAAQVLLEIGVNEVINVHDLTTLDKWRYPLTLAITLASWAKASAIIETIAGAQPGFATWLVGNSVPTRTARSDAQLPGHLECARRLRRTLEVWTSACRPVSSAFMVTDGAGRVRTVGTYVAGNHLTSGLRVDAFIEPGVQRLPGGIGLFRSRGTDGSIWYPLRGDEVPVEFSAWPWRSSLTWVAASLEGVLKSQVLPLPTCEPFLLERRWSIARALMQQDGNGAHRPISKADAITAARHLIPAAGSRVPPYIFIGRTKRVVGLRELSDFAKYLDDNTCSGDETLHRPYPIPNMDTAPTMNLTYIGDFYAPESLRVLVEAVYQNALIIYEALVDTYFPQFKAMLGLGCILPVCIDGALQLRDEESWSAGLDYFMRPVPPNEPSRAEIRLIEDQAEIAMSWEELLAQNDHVRGLIRVYHAGSASWAQPKNGSTVLSVFNDRPATSQAYIWLWEDLKRLNLVEAMPPIGEDW